MAGWLRKVVNVDPVQLFRASPANSVCIRTLRWLQAMFLSGWCPIQRSANRRLDFVNIVQVELERRRKCEYDQVTGGRFRHGTRFVRWRPDKDPKQ